MQWEYLTSGAFAEAVRDTQVCVVGMGVLERHSDHLPLGLLQHLPAFVGIGWYANYPEHYAGDARTASAEKERALVGWMVDTLAAYIAAVKADEVVPALEREFFEREARLRETEA